MCVKTADTNVVLHFAKINPHFKYNRRGFTPVRTAKVFSKLKWAEKQFPTMLICSLTLDYFHS